MNCRARRVARASALAAQLRAAGCATAPSDDEVAAQCGGDDEGLVQGARARRARPAEPGRDAARVQRVLRQGRCRRTSRRRSRRRISRRSSGPPTASSSATGRTARRSRRRAAACSIPTIPRGRAGAQLLRVPPARAAGALVRHDRPEPLPVRQAARLQRPTRSRYAYGKIYNADAFNACSQHAALRPQRHPDRAADQGRRRAADGPAVARQQVTRRSREARTGVSEVRLARRSAMRPPRIRAGRLAAAASCRRGLPLGGAAARRRRTRASVYDVPRFGNVALLHFTDCHAQLLPTALPRAERQSRRRRDARAVRRISSARRLLQATSASRPARATRTRSPISISMRRRGPTARSAASRISPRWSSG